MPHSAEYTPVIGDLYPSFDEAWYMLCSFSHRSRGSLRVRKCDFTQLHLVSVDSHCTFDAFVLYSRRKGDTVKAYHLKRLCSTHSCSGGEHVNRGTMHNLEFIKRVVSLQAVAFLTGRSPRGCRSVMIPRQLRYRAGIEIGMAPAFTERPSGSGINYLAMLAAFRPNSSPDYPPTSTISLIATPTP